MYHTINFCRFQRWMTGLVVALLLVGSVVLFAVDDLKAQGTPPPSYANCSGKIVQNNSCTQPAECVRGTNNVCASRITIMEIGMLTDGVKGDNAVAQAAQNTCAFRYVCTPNQRGGCDSSTTPKSIFTNQVQRDGGDCTIPQ